MNEEKLGCISKAILKAFHPILIPIYISVILFFSDNSFVFLTLWGKILFLLLMCGLTLLIPLALLPLLKKLKLIGNLELTTKRDRFIAYTFVSIFYMLVQLLVVNNFSIFIIYRILACLNMVLMITAILSSFYKFDVHSIASGALISIFFFLNNTGYLSLEAWLIASFFFFGLTGAAKLYLDKTTVMKSFVGLILGFVSTSFIFLM